MEVFTTCPGLQKCSIIISTIDEPLFHLNDSDIPKVVLPHLRTFKLIRDAGPIDDILTLINKLWTSNLRHFAYDQSNNQPGPPFVLESLTSAPFHFTQSLCSFFQRLNEPLEEFEYSSDLLSRKYMIKVLSCLPGLKRLSLKEFNTSPSRGFGSNEFDDRFLAQFIPYEHRMRYLCDEDFKEEEDDEEEEEEEEEEEKDEGEDGVVEEDHFPQSICLCPNLEVLNVLEVIYSERVLLEFLRSRSADHHKYNISHLRRANIAFKDHTSPKSNTKGHIRDMAKHIHDLEKDTGLRVRLSYSPVLLLPPSTVFRYNYKSPYSGIYHVSVSSVHSNHQVGYIKFDL